MHVEASSLLHVNQLDEAYVRVGDKNRKLGFEDRMNLMYAKGIRHYEDEPVDGAKIGDLDLGFVSSYCKRIGYGKSAEGYLRENKNFITTKDGRENISAAAILLFGKRPQEFFPRARVRFIRYEGVEAKVGREMNVIKDVVFEGRLLEQVEKSIDYVKAQMKEKTYLGKDGRFLTEEEYGEFVRTELIVNAVAHRDYSIKGTDIQVKMFDDRIEVDSPGTLPGMVKKENIRFTHFSRNPKICAFFKDYGYVKEYGEGVDRMHRELSELGLPGPSFDSDTFILKTTVMSASFKKENASIQNENASIEDENARFGDENASIDVTPKAKAKRRDLALEKNRLKEIIGKSLIEGKISNKDGEALNRILRKVDVRQVITYKEIMSIMSCQHTKASAIMKTMEARGLIRKVEGIGKGKYILDTDSSDGD